jgi:hypothetical protein
MSQEIEAEAAVRTPKTRLLIITLLAVIGTSILVSFTSFQLEKELFGFSNPHLFLIMASILIGVWGIALLGGIWLWQAKTRGKLNSFNIHSRLNDRTSRRVDRFLGLDKNKVGDSQIWKIKNDGICDRLRESIGWHWLFLLIVIHFLSATGVVFYFRQLADLPGIDWTEFRRNLYWFLGAYFFQLTLAMAVLAVTYYWVGQFAEEMEKLVIKYRGKEIEEFKEIKSQIQDNQKELEKKLEADRSKQKSDKIQGSNAEPPEED